MPAIDSEVIYLYSDDIKARRRIVKRFFLTLSVCAGLIAWSLLPSAAVGAQSTRLTIGANVDVSQRHTNESEEAVAVNPTNPKNIVIVTNVDFPAAGMFEGVSFDGGATWTKKLIGIGGKDNLGAACCDPSLSFDNNGNLFMNYLYKVGNVV